MMNVRTKTRQIESMDMAKLVMAISIVAMHSSLFTGTPLACLIWPWARVSVPLFFIMSSFFLFRKSEIGQGVAHTISRLVRMYIFWFTVSLPITIIYRANWWWKDDGIMLCFVRFLRSLMFSGTFGASWYLAALCVALLLFTFFLRIRLFAGGGICFLFYIFTCLWSSYLFCIVPAGNPLLLKVHWFEEHILLPHRSFMVAMFWVWIGHLMAVRRMPTYFTLKRLLALLIMFGMLLWCKWAWVWHMSRLHRNDCYFMLAPCCMILFLILCKAPNCNIVREIEERVGKGSFRKVSTVMFFVHLQIQSVLGELIPNGYMYNIPLFFLSVVFSIVIFMVIEKARCCNLCCFLQWAY